jgi:hypothetical protein
MFCIRAPSMDAEHTVRLSCALVFSRILPVQFLWLGHIPQGVRVKSARKRRESDAAQRVETR